VGSDALPPAGAIQTRGNESDSTETCPSTALGAEGCDFYSQMKNEAFRRVGRGRCSGKQLAF